MGGSTVDSRVVKPYMAGTSLFDQMRDFFRWYGNDSPRAPWKSDDTLFMFWFGVNDIALTHSRSRELFDDHHRPAMPEIFESYTNLVSQVSPRCCYETTSEVSSIRIKLHLHQYPCLMLLECSLPSNFLHPFTVSGKSRCSFP